MKIKKAYGATYDYAEYHPHVTVTYDYGDREIPSTVPPIAITFDAVKIEALDADKDYTKGK